MTIRPFHLIPNRSEADHGWRAAVFFSIVALVGAIPGILSVFFFGSAFIGGLVEGNIGAAALGGAFIAYIGWGFAQAAFYLGRLAGPGRNDAFWWGSTCLYNLPVAVMAGLWLIGEPGLESAGAAFTGFVGLALAFRAWLSSDVSA